MLSALRNRKLIRLGAALGVVALLGVGCEAWKKTFRDDQGNFTFNPAPLGLAARAAFEKGVAVFKPKPENRRQPTTAESETARSQAAEVVKSDQTAGQQRSADYYVPVGKDDQKQQVVVQRIDHKSNQPVGDVAMLSEADLNEAARKGNTIKVDGHDLVGKQ